MRGRRSTGKVKLKLANGVLSLTVPKSQEKLAGEFIGDEFLCEVGHNYIDDIIVFTRIKPTHKLKLRLR